jgi:prepilin-type N-terminal cleavage/methylation domain-containing protein
MQIRNARQCQGLTVEYRVLRFGAEIFHNFSSKERQMNAISQKNAGFTLIELVMVIVILGIIAAFAIPKYVDLKGSADAAVTAHQNGVTDVDSKTKAACLKIPNKPATECDGI